MGSGSFDAKAYRAYTTSTASKTRDEIFTSRHIHKLLDPKGVKIRESRDSADNPNSTPIIVALDVTGSMGSLAEVLAREGLGTLFNEILDRKPVTNPHLMFMAVGDPHCDEAPLQVSQFEADNRIVEQLTQIYIESGGGGNQTEGYNLPWYFAAKHTEHDSFIKRGKRGYLFTIGDEESPVDISKEQIERFIGDKLEADVNNGEILRDVQRTYDVFHVIIKEGDYASSHPDSTIKSWTKLLGQHVIQLADHKKLAETIVSIIEVVEGRDAKAVTAKFGAVVFDAVKHLPPSKTPRLALPA